MTTCANCLPTAKRECSFCGSDVKDCKILIAGRGSAHICAGCVGECIQIVADQLFPSAHARAIMTEKFEPTNPTGAPK